MTTSTDAPDHTADRRIRLSLGGVVRAEAVKLLSLRSTWWSLGATVVVMALFALAQAASLQILADNPELGGTVMTGAEVVSGGYQFGMLVVAVLGVLAITGEYSSGMIRSTLTAVPTRIPMLAAKAVVLAVLTVLVGAVSLAASAAVTLPLLSRHGLVPALDAAETWQVCGGMVYFLVSVALLSLGVGTILRNSSAAITSVLGLLLLLPMVLPYIRLEWVQQLTAYLPVSAATAFLALNDRLVLAVELTAWQGVIVVALYPVLTLAVGAVLLLRRDA